MISVFSTKTTSPESKSTIACKPLMGWAYKFANSVGRCHIGVQISLLPSSSSFGIWAPIGQVSICT